MITAARRQKNSLPLEGLRSDYDIAKRNSRFRRKRSGVSTVGTSGDYHYASESDFLYTIEFARDLDRNDPIAGMVVDRLIDNVLQDCGIRPDPDTGVDELDEAIKAKWNDWAVQPRDCDLSGEMTFRAIERAVLRAVLVDGDIFSLPNESGALELIEAHRCRTPRTKRNVVHGVLQDSDRKRLEYWFTQDEVDPWKTFSRVSDMVKVPARDEFGNRQVFHVANPDRVSQTRGVSVFRRNADMLGMHDDIQFANLVRQQIASCFALIEETESNSDHLPGSPGLGSRTTETSGGYSRTVEGISPGVRYKTDPGVKLTGFSPNIPNPQFFEHVMLVLKIVSANLNLPLHAVLLDASQTNFSGWRGAHDQARLGFKRIQQWFIDRFHREVYRWKVAQWIDDHPEWQQHLNAGADPFKAEWTPPKWEYVQPVQDTAADVGQISGLLDSWRHVLGKRGIDIDSVTKDMVNDNKSFILMCMKAAHEINEQSAANGWDWKVHWRELTRPPTHDNIKLSVSLGAEGATTEEEAENE